MSTPTTTASTASSLDSRALPDLSGRSVLVPGGTGGVGEGVVRTALAAGAVVVVPTRSAERGEELRAALGPVARSGRLHLVVHDYATFEGAQDLARRVVDRLGGLDDVVAPIGGWWSGGPVWSVEEQDWRSAVVDLLGTHLGVLRACLPHMGRRGAYTVVVGQSATTPVPGSSLVSIEQAGVLMMQRVASVEAASSRRVFALVLGPVRTRTVDAEDAREWVSADQVGEVAVALAAGPSSGDQVQLGSAVEADEVLARLRSAPGADGGGNTGGTVHRADALPRAEV